MTREHRQCLAKLFLCSTSIFRDRSVSLEIGHQIRCKLAAIQWRLYHSRYLKPAVVKLTYKAYKLYHSRLQVHKAYEYIKLTSFTTAGFKYRLW